MQYFEMVLKRCVRACTNLLALCVERRCGLVQQQKFGITDQSSSDGYPLFLSSRQLSAFISDSSVVFLKGY